MSDTDTMKAGRELDALVAEKVMGHRVTEEPFDGGQGITGTSLFEHTEPGDYKALPHYSTDIAAAWDVAVKMDLGVAPVEVYIGEGEPGGPRRTVYAAFVLGGALTISDDDLLDGNPRLWLGEIDGPWTVADTAPLAICLAALKAVEASHVS